MSDNFMLHAFSPFEGQKDHPSFHMIQKGPWGTTVNGQIDKTSHLNVAFDEQQYEETKQNPATIQPGVDFSSSYEPHYPVWPPPAETGFLYPNSSKADQTILLGDEKGTFEFDQPFITTSSIDAPPSAPPSTEILNDKPITPEELLNFSINNNFNFNNQYQLSSPSISYEATFQPKYNLHESINYPSLAPYPSNLSNPLDHVNKNPLLVNNNNQYEKKYIKESFGSRSSYSTEPLEPINSEFNSVDNSQETYDSPESSYVPVMIKSVKKSIKHIKKCQGFSDYICTLKKDPDQLYYLSLFVINIIILYLMIQWMCQGILCMDKTTGQTMNQLYWFLFILFMFYLTMYPDN